MIFDGQKRTKEILSQVRKDVSELPHPLVVRAIAVQASRATDSYLKTKKLRARDAGMELEVVRLGDTATTEEVLQALFEPGADALLVQLPLPDFIDTKRVLDAIPLSKDADVLSSEAHARFESGAPGALLPPVVGAVKDILEHAHISPKGKRVVVVGKGWLVGEPVAIWMKNVEAHVTVLTREEGDFSLLKEADIIVSGAGEGGIIKPEHLTAGVVLIDAGTSESGGSIVGDADPACAEIASVFTPVPGGVGPMAVACLFRNTAILAKQEKYLTDSHIL